MAISNRIFQILTNIIYVGTKNEPVLKQVGIEEDEAEKVDDLEDTQSIVKPVGAKEKQVEGTLPLQQIPKPPLPFSQRLSKKAEDGEFTEFITMLRKLSVNTPLVEALEQMPGYSMFMEDFVTKKREVSIELTNHFITVVLLLPGLWCRRRKIQVHSPYHELLD